MQGQCSVGQGLAPLHEARCGWVFLALGDIFREYSLTLKRIFVIFREWKCFYVRAYLYALTYLPHPNPSFVLGVPLRSSVVPAVYKTIEFMPEFTCPTPRLSAAGSPRIFLNLSIYCRLYKGVQDPISFTVTTGLLGWLGLGLRVRVSIGIIFTFFRNLL